MSGHPSPDNAGASTSHGPTGETSKPAATAPIAPEPAHAGSAEQTDAESTAPEIDVLAPWGEDGPPPAGPPTPDVLGAGFTAQTLELSPDDEGENVATLVRYEPAADPVFATDASPWLPLVGDRAAGARPRAAVLYLHGRNDYFFHTETARQLASLGLRFYALDLRKYGRSLRPHQTIGYVSDLRTYDEEIDIAIRLISDVYPELPLLLLGHSAGGLVATWYAFRNQGLVSGVILNSAWLELQTLTPLRPAVQQIIGRVADVRPHATILSSGLQVDHMAESSYGGWNASGLPLPPELAAYPDDPAVVGWDYAHEWKRPDSYDAPAAWVDAILRAHGEVERRVKLDCPVLSFCSTGHGSALRWSPAVFSTDTLLNPDLIAQRSVGLSNCMTLRRLPGRHDMAMSDPAVRAEYFRTIARWLDAFVLD